MNAYEKLWDRYIRSLENRDRAKAEGKTGRAFMTYKRAVRHWQNKLEEMNAEIEKGVDTKHSV